MEFVYKLPCGKCGTENFISSSVSQVTWFCINCDAFSYSGLPTKSNCRTLIDVPDQTESLTYTNVSQLQPGEQLSESYVAGTYNPFEDPKRKDEIRWQPQGSLLPDPPTIGEVDG
jgi:hypothetical protein